MALTFRSLNNATVVMESGAETILIDPWIVGDLYNGAWSPVEIPKDLSFLKKVTHVLISHIHQDHWDIDTIKLISSDAIFYVPDCPFIQLIVCQLEKIGFRVEILAVSEWHHLSGEFSVKIIPSLNSRAQQLEKYKDIAQIGPAIDIRAIDTGFLIFHHKTNSNHLVLCDNTPYDKRRVNKEVGKYKISTMWVPFNGYAGDYPLCYDNLTVTEKQNISKKQNRIREASLLSTVEDLSPKYIIPHSSDFILNGPRRTEFKIVHEESFAVRELYVNRLNTILNRMPETECTAVFLHSSDVASMVTGELMIERNIYAANKQVSKENLMLPVASIPHDLTGLVSECAKKMFDRCEKYSIDLSETRGWLLIIKCDDVLSIAIDLYRRDLIDFKDEYFSNSKRLQVDIEPGLLVALLTKLVHWNNAEIGCYLSWRREPDVFSSDVYDALNFFHT